MNGVKRIKYPDGRIGEGPMVDDVPQGQWTVTLPDGTIGEGPMVDGKRHGQWTITRTDGTSYKIQYIHGVKQ